MSKRIKSTLHTNADSIVRLKYLCGLDRNFFFLELTGFGKMWELMIKVPLINLENFHLSHEYTWLRKETY